MKRLLVTPLQHLLVAHCLQHRLDRHLRHARLQCLCGLQLLLPLLLRTLRRLFSLMLLLLSLLRFCFLLLPCLFLFLSPPCRLLFSLLHRLFLSPLRLLLLLFPRHCLALRRLSLRRLSLVPNQLLFLAVTTLHFLSTLHFLATALLALLSHQRVEDAHRVLIVLRRLRTARRRSGEIEVLQRHAAPRQRHLAAVHHLDQVLHRLTFLRSLRLQVLVRLAVATSRKLHRDVNHLVIGVEQIVLTHVVAHAQQTRVGCVRQRLTKLHDSAARRLHGGRQSTLAGGSVQFRRRHEGSDRGRTRRRLR